MLANPKNRFWNAHEQSEPTTNAARVEETYEAILLRANELRYSGSPETKEHHQFDAALYFLRLLRIVQPFEPERR